MVEEKNNIMTAKSVHTFLWPFMNENVKGDFPIDSSKLIKKGWKEKEFDITKENTDFEDYKNKYMWNQYFNQKAKNIFSSVKEPRICKVLEIPKERFEGVTYQIEKDKEKIYELDLYSVEMHLFNFNVGILMFTVLNHKYHDLSEIKYINDVGRRVSLPFLPSEIGENMFLGTAARLALAGKNGVISEKNFKKDLLECKDKSYSKLASLAQPMEILDYLLNANFESDVKKNTIKANPFTDDRMFLIAAVRDDLLSKKIKSDLKSDKLKDEIYALLFADQGDPTCQNKEMRDDILNHALYTRWSNLGSLTGVTNYSFMLFTSTSNEINDSVVRPFLVEYKYFVSLVLAQRLGLMIFSKRANACAFSDKYGKKYEGQAKEASNLKDQYCIFENQILLQEITSQDQGIDLYRILQKQLFIEEEKEKIKTPISNLAEIMQLKIASKRNKLLFALTVIGAGFSLYNIIINFKLSYFCNNGLPTSYLGWIIAEIIFIIYIIIKFRPKD